MPSPKRLSRFILANAPSRRSDATRSLAWLIVTVAFAKTLANPGLGVWDRLANLLVFNLGIEAMQLIVVAAALPALILLSRGIRMVTLSRYFAVRNS